MIEVDSLCFRYPKQDSDTIKGIGFKVDAGEIFGFLGPSGSGKSTTQKLLIGLLNNYSGDIALLGKDAKAWKHDLYQHIGVGFELPNHFAKLSGLENLKLFASFYGAGRKKESLSPMELLELVDLTESANRRVGQYSKGMKMRLNFARAMLNDPQILFLDEPTAGLDPVTARRIKDIIKAQQEIGKTIFLTTHNMHDADELCDRVAFIVEGSLRLMGAPKSLKQEHGQHSVCVETVSNTNPEVSNSQEFPLLDIGNNPAFIDLIKRQKVTAIHSQEATLEEVFIKTTGSNLL